MGSPYEIYLHPKNNQVSAFIGRSNIVLVDGKERLVRPENITLRADAQGAYTIMDKNFMGPKTEYRISDGADTLEVEVSGIPGAAFEIGQRVSITYSGS